MTPADQLIWEEKLEAQNKAMLLLMNLKNNNAKKDLSFAYVQGNCSAYPETVKSMARFVLLQYNIKTVNNLCDKKWDKNRKKGDEIKSEDKHNSNTGTAGAHVGEPTMPQNSSTPSNVSSIGAHVSDVTKPVVWLAQSVQDILAAHPVGDSI